MKIHAPYALASLILAVGLTAGCGNKEGAEGKKGGDPVSGYVRGTLEAKEHATGSVGLSVLQANIKLYNASEQGYPKSLDDLVKKGYVASLPPAPVGKKYSYNASNGSVKIVDK
jgi:hypothetical protein